MGALQKGNKMSKVTYGQRGYVGSSMSTRAQAAYEAGEMPKSKWTKAVIVNAIKSFCDDDDRVYDPSIEKMKKADLQDAFISWKSWHHTSRYANMTNFYGINEAACEERFERMPDCQIEEREAKRKAEAKAERERDDSTAEQTVKEFEDTKFVSEIVEP